MDLKNTYNKIAEDWHADHQQDDWWIEGTNTFISMLSSGAGVLDVGCGGGFKSGYLQQRGLRVTGVDFSEKLIAIAKREVSGPEFLVADMRDLSCLGSRRFDGVFAQASLLHIPKGEVTAVLAGLHALIKPDGLLYIAVKGTRPGGLEEEIKEENDYGYPYQRFFSYFEMEELEKHFESLGLEVVYKNTNPVGRTEWLQIIGRKPNE